MNSKMLPKKSREQGSSMVEVLVGVGILAISALGTFKGISHVSNTRAYMEHLSDVELIRGILLQSTDCDRISVCSANQKIQLTDYEGTILVSDQGNTKFKGLTIQAQCLADKTIDVRVGKPVGTGFARNPITKKLIDFKSRGSVIIPAGVLCGKINLAKSTNLSIINGPQCVGETQGTCPSPASGDDSAASTVCCFDGSNGIRPICTSGKREVSAYWDREDDWGGNGKWVVICQ